MGTLFGYFARLKLRRPSLRNSMLCTLSGESEYSRYMRPTACWDRPELHRMLDQLRDGDIVIDWKLD